jgi:multimeric flavodoxin WrbA
MKVIAINGSPRKNWNTHILLNKALEGAHADGAQTELSNLYDLDYKGCISCLACKVKNGKNLGHCAVHDGLKPVLDAIHLCDGFILGSPIYFGDVTAMMRAFWERLIFQYLSYDDYTKPFFKGTKKTAFIYTMNASESFFHKIGYTNTFKTYENTLQMYFGNAVHMVSTETLQVTDYSKYHMASFNEAERKKRREENFPHDCEKAYELGKSIAK